MKKYFYYRENGDVAFYSNTKQICDLKEVIINDSDIDLYKLENNYYSNIIDNKLVFEEKEIDSINLRQEIENATDINDLKNIIKKLI